MPNDTSRQICILQLARGSLSTCCCWVLHMLQLRGQIGTHSAAQLTCGWRLGVVSASMGAWMRLCLLSTRYQPSSRGVARVAAVRRLSHQQPTAVSWHEAGTRSAFNPIIYRVCRYLPPC